MVTHRRVTASYASLCIRVTSTVLPTTVPHHTHRSSIALRRCTVLHGGFTSGSLHRTSVPRFPQSVAASAAAQQRPAAAPRRAPPRARPRRRALVVPIYLQDSLDHGGIRHDRREDKLRGHVRTLEQLAVEKVLLVP